MRCLLRWPGRGAPPPGSLPCPRGCGSWPPDIRVGRGQRGGRGVTLGGSRACSPGLRVLRTFLAASLAAPPEPAAPRTRASRERGQLCRLQRPRPAWSAGLAGATCRPVGTRVKPAIVEWAPNDTCSARGRFDQGSGWSRIGANEWCPLLPAGRPGLGPQCPPICGAFLEPPLCRRKSQKQQSS